MARREGRPLRAAGAGVLGLRLRVERRGRRAVAVGGRLRRWIAWRRQRPRCEAVVVVGFAERAGEAGLQLGAAGRARRASGSIYRKIHLFDREKELFAPGDRPPEVIEVGGVRLRSHDLLRLDLSRRRRARSRSWAPTCCATRPISCFRTARTPWSPGASRTACSPSRPTGRARKRGPGSRSPSPGSREVVSPRGAILTRGSSDREEVLVAEIDPAAARDKLVTPGNDLFRDRRPDLYRLR